MKLKEAWFPCALGSAAGRMPRRSNPSGKPLQHLPLQALLACCMVAAAVPTAAQTTTTITVRASGRLAANVGPRMDVLVNGVKIGSREVRSSSYQDYSFSAPAVPAGAKVDVVFNNDYLANGEDRNLFVDSMTVHGSTTDAAASGVRFDRGSGAKAFDGVDVLPGLKTLFWNGALRFKVATAPSGGTASAWVRVAMEGQPFAATGTNQVRYGSGTSWITRTMIGGGQCGIGDFGGVDPAPGIEKQCELLVIAPAVAQTGGMPVVNTAFIPPPLPGAADARVRTLSAEERLQPHNVLGGPFDIGAFRVPCAASHMAADDPIVFPGQPGRSHLHTFFGNVGANAHSTASSLQTTGNSTCAGGILNRSSYWVPSLIDTRNGAPVMPLSAIFYYKGGYNGVPQASIRPMPRGLRMVVGDASNTQPLQNPKSGLTCHNAAGQGDVFPNCRPGNDVMQTTLFPQCWDGVHLDSPDHKSHMAYATYPQGCPASHPVGLPEITFNVHYPVTVAGEAVHWRLSSDNYVGPAGYSAHADWFDGWDPDPMQTFVSRCINPRMNCHAYLLGDGRTLY